MIDGTAVGAGEYGVVRVFTLVRPLDLQRGAVVPIEQIADWLGVSALREADVQQIWTDDIAGDFLEDLLKDGYGIESTEFEQQSATFDHIAELHPTLVVLMRSGAFIDKPVHLHQDGPLFLISTLKEQGANVVFEPLPNPDPVAAIESPPQKKRPSDAAMSGRVATVALLVMALLVGLMIWIAG